MARSWSIFDFILVMLGGFFGTALLAAVGAVMVGNDEIFVILALAGQYLGSLVVVALLRRQRPELGLEVRGRDSLYLFAGLGLQLALSILFIPVVVMLFPDGGQAQEVGSIISDLEGNVAAVTAFGVSALLAPFTEEIAFRGVLLKALGDRSRRSLIVISSLVFTLFHLLGLSTDNLLAAAAVVLPQLFLVGLALAWVTLRSRRLGPAIFLHSGYNLLAAIVLLLPPEAFSP